MAVVDGLQSGTVGRVLARSFRITMWSIIRRVLLNCGHDMRGELSVLDQVPIRTGEVAIGFAREVRRGLPKVALFDDLAVVLFQHLH